MTAPPRLPVAGTDVTRTEGLYIDHVIYGVVDVDATAERLRRDYGLGSVSGGIHLGGTTNRVVPLAPPSYLELLGVGDPALSDGAWLSQTLGGRDRVLWWVLGVDDLDDAARRRGLPIQSGTMEMADGSSRHLPNRRDAPLSPPVLHLLRRRPRRPACGGSKPAIAKPATTANPEHSPS